MDYDLLEQHIYDNDIEIYDSLQLLAPFYRYKLYEKLRDISRLSADTDAFEIALNIIKYLPKLKKHIIDSFELASFSYHELLCHQRITNQRLTQKANRARINIRRVLKIERDTDEVQQRFDDDKKARYEQMKFGGISVQDSIEKKTKNNRARDWAIAQSLNDAMVVAGFHSVDGQSGYFLTLTLPSKFHFTSYERANEAMQKSLENIKRKTERQGVVWTGTYAIELHKDETPHIHIIYYVRDYDYGVYGYETDKQKLEKIIFDEFIEEKINYQKNSGINQTIWYFEGVLRYMFKDYGKPNVKQGFIGLRRDIKSIWNSIYVKDFGNKSLSYLSDKKLFSISKIIRDEELNKYTLFCLQGFKSIELNRFADKDYSRAQSDYSRFNDENWRDMIPVYDAIKIHKILYSNRANIRYKKYRKTLIKSHEVYYFVNFYLYINTKIVYRFEVVASRAQPPPVGKGWIIF